MAQNNLPRIISGYFFKQFLSGPTLGLVVQLLIHIQRFVAPCTPGSSVLLCLPEYQSVLKLVSIESVMPSNHLILCCPLLLLPSTFPTLRVFSKESFLCIRWPKDWSFSISPSNEYSGLISFRTDWFDLLAVQGTLKSSPAPKFKSVSSLVLSLLYSPTLTSIHYYWKNHSFDYMDSCRGFPLQRILFKSKLYPPSDY